MLRFSLPLVLALAIHSPVANAQTLQSAIQAVTASKWMSNFPDGQFHPERFLSRAEIAAILVKAFDLERLRPSQTVGSLRDVPPTHWAYRDIQIVVRTGVMEGYESERFFPNQRVSRAEGFAIFANAYGVFQFPKETIDEILVKFADAAQIPTWARRAMATALNEGFVNLTEGKIEPLQPLTRADMAYALNQYLEQDRGRNPMTTPVLQK